MEAIARKGQVPPLDSRTECFRFQVTDWFVPESDKAAREMQRKSKTPYQTDEDQAIPEYDIYMYGVTAEGFSVCAHVTNFHPYFYVKPPAKMAKMTADDVDYMIRNGKRWSPKFKCDCRVVPKKFMDAQHLVGVEKVRRKDFWGFTNGEEFTFFKITVKSLALFNIISRFFKDKAEEGWRLYESNIDPFLRFIHERNIQPCGWVKLKPKKYDIAPEDAKFARTSYAVRVNYNDVFAEEINKIAPLVIASFDLECTSSHGDFPVAHKNYRKLAMDLVTAARALKDRHVGTDELWSWILGSFKAAATTTEGAEIHQVFTKEKASQKSIAAKLEPILEDVTGLVQKIAAAKSGTHDTGAADDDDDTDESPITAVSSSVTMELENNLVDILTSNLPALQGDPIIQIGTTVHIYGSDKIVYRHIATLHSCDPVEGAEVESFDTEEELLQGWKDLIVRLDPDILTGYNIFGFDMDYVWSRAAELGMLSETSDFAIGFGRLNERKTTLLEQRLSSSALGDNILKYVDMDGVISIDMFKVMQRDHKLDSYKLDNVAGVFLGDHKEDLKPKQIFEKFGGSAADRRDIATYCLQDCALCNRLMHKLKVLENNVGMGNVCSVPLSYLFMRGQGVKIFSLVAKECRAKDHLIPVIKGFNPHFEDDADGYEGAIVLEPKEGIYLDDPITVLDYSSLYPSSMIARNLSHDCFVNDEKYAKLENAGITYLTVSYDVYEGTGDKKKCIGKKDCTFAQLPEGKKGIIPSILQQLLSARKNTRKKIEYETVHLTDGRVAVGLVTKEHDDGSLDMLNVDNADVCKGFGGCKATIPADLIERREQTFSSFEQAVLDALQLAYKVTANSLYGQIGSRTSPIYWKDIAACTTATGREMIMTAKNFVETQYGAEVVYGDSVSGDTPLLVKDMNGHVSVKTIETLVKTPQEWVDYENFRPWDPERTDKEQTGFEGYVWSDGTWARIARVIRHKVKKRMFRVNTFQGCVDVTEDHSLLTSNSDPIKPTECVVGESELLHSFPTQEMFPETNVYLPRYYKQSPNTACANDQEIFNCSTCYEDRPGTMFYYDKKGKRCKQCKMCVKKRTCERVGKEFNGQVNRKVLDYDVPSRELTKEEAWVMGLFFADGSCGFYECNSCDKMSWAINKQNLDTLNRAKEYLEKVEDLNIVKFKILDTMESSHVYKLVCQGDVAYMVEKYRALFYDKDRYKVVPNFLFNAPLEIKKWFVNGYLFGDDSKNDLTKGQASFACKGKIGAMGLYTMLNAVGYTDIRVNIHDYKPNIYFIRTSVDKKYIEANQNLVIKITELDNTEEQYVYDIETSEGKFNAGVGALVVKNTDSIFLKFRDQISVDETKSEKLAKSIAAGQRASREIKSILPPPQCLEYEKTLYPFILFSKKRYVGNLYEDDPNKKPKQKSMGIVLKRRDNANIVKKVYGGIIDIILNKQDLDASVVFLKEQLQSLVDGQVDLQDLIITKTLRAEYKDPTKIAHKVLADRMAARDPGNKPMANDRIPFVYIRPPPGVEVKLQGDRIEHPDFIRESGITPDYRFYITNQLLNPICQLYALCVEKLPGYSYSPGYWVQIEEELMTKDIYRNSEKKRKDRLTALRMKEVEELLFDPYISQLEEVKKQAAPKKPRGSAAKKTETMLADPLTVRIVVTDNKKEKQYDCVGTLSDDEVIETVTLNIEKKRKTTTKQYALRQTAETIMRKIHMNPLVRSRGIRFELDDKTFARDWKAAITKADEHRTALQKAISTQDLGALRELQEQFVFENLVNMLDAVPYVVSTSMTKK